MTRAKNAVNVIMKNYTDACFGALAFRLIGYGLMFGTNPTGWFGSDHFSSATPSTCGHRRLAQRWSPCSPSSPDSWPGS
jgi:ammonia channel protein AmtB